MNNLTNTTIEKITEFLNGLTTEIPITDYLDLENIDFDNAYDSIFNMVQDNNGFNIEIIYYSRAIEYLKENDPSLKSSLEIAEQLGYSVSSLSSEILASLLASENAQSEFSDLAEQVREMYHIYHPKTRKRIGSLTSKLFNDFVEPIAA